jgi:hypothetical protein
MEEFLNELKELIEKHGISLSLSQVIGDDRKLKTCLLAMKMDTNEASMSCHNQFENKDIDIDYINSMIGNIRIMEGL